jgi:hypothetical protein
MPRIRTIDPHFPQTASLSRVSREARLFFILLWTVADDAGRLRLDHERLKERLYPLDDDALLLMPLWIGELESARCIEVYRVDDVDYLRVRKWRQLQVIQRPTRSRLPRAPQESQEFTEESPRMQMPRASKAIPPEDAIYDEGEAEVGDPNSITPERVLGDLDIVLRKARRKEALTSADARYFDFAGRKLGLWGGRAAPAGRKEPEEEDVGPSPADLLGPNAARY